MMDTHDILLALKRFLKNKNVLKKVIYLAQNQFFEKNMYVHNYGWKKV